MAEVEDDDFLSQVAAMEADALSSKRRKTTATTPGVGNSSDAAEGVYMAALKGSKSHLFQQQQQLGISNNKSDSISFGIRNSDFSTGTGGGSCFKCGKSGHWARDCDVNGSGSLSGDLSVPEKACPCGLGICLVRTAKTEKNSGRKFYKCPQVNFVIFVSITF